MTRPTTRDELLEQLLLERYGRPTPLLRPKPPGRAAPAVDDDEVTIARRRRELLADFDQSDRERRRTGT